jgi:hypothetical protein
MIRGKLALISRRLMASTAGFTADQPLAPRGVVRLNSTDRSTPMSSNRFIAVCLFLLSCLCCSPLSAQFRQPLGIYARNTSGCSPATNQTQDQCLSAKAVALVANPAVAGIDAEIQWKDLNPAPGVYTWNELEDVLSAVDAWNQSNPGKTRKNVQIGVNPGFNTPQWVFDNMTPCDPMFGANSEANPDGSLNKNWMQYNPPRPDLVSKDCGYVTFLEFENASTPLLPLPLPWSPYYKSAWATFVHAFAQKFGNNPDVVSVSIAGPTASSSEMILSNENNDPLNFYKWNYLFALTFPPSYQNSDRAFIEAWQDAIDLFSESFAGVTLVLTDGNGLPNFLSPPTAIGTPAATTGAPYQTYSVPPGFSPVCADPDQTKIMECAAEASVIAYFADPLVGGLNLKSYQEDGFGAGAILIHPLGGGDLATWAVRWLAQTSMNGITVLPGSFTFISKVFGGFQSVGGITSSAANTQAEGCTLPGAEMCSGLSKEQALYNCMQNFFEGTKLGALYGPGNVYNPTVSVVAGTIPLNYLQLYDVDITYANANACDIAGGSCTQILVTDGAGRQSLQSFQSILETAATQIRQIADPTVGFSFVF